MVPWLGLGPEYARLQPELFIFYTIYSNHKQTMVQLVEIRCRKSFRRCTIIIHWGIFLPLIAVKLALF